VKTRIFSFAACGLFVLASSGNSFASTITLDFDSVDATAGTVDSTAYLASYGITLSNVTGGTVVGIIDDINMYGGFALVPNSGTNFLTQVNSNAPVSFQLNFGTALESFGFSIPGQQAPSLFPAFQAFAYAGATLLDSETGSLGAFGPRTYTLAGAGISRVVINSQNFNVAAFSGIPLDDLVLVTSEVPEPGSMILLGTGLAGLWRSRRKVTGRS
jgi:hypothetical protein